MSTHENRPDQNDCPCCGRDALTVDLARRATNIESILETVAALPFRPMHDVHGQQVVLVEVATNEAVRAWSGDEARSLTAEVAAGPYAASVCFKTGKGVVTFQGSELVALLVVLEAIIEQLGSTCAECRSKDARGSGR